MTTSYVNNGGSGYRNSQRLLSISTTITFAVGSLAKLIDGDTVTNDTFFNSGSSKEIKIDWGTPRVMDEALWYQNSTATHGTWQWAGSNDDSIYTNIGATFTLGGATPSQAHTTLNGNLTAYRYYKLSQTAGSLNTGPFIRAIEFKVDDNYDLSVPSYNHPVGSGARTGTVTATCNGITSGTASNFVDGDWATGSAGSLSFTAAATEVKFDFGTAKILTEASWMQSDASTHGTWQWQGSPDGSSWTSIGSTFTLGGTAAPTPQLLTELSGNVTAYRYYRMTKTAGTASNSPWLMEIEFKAKDGGGGGGGGSGRRRSVIIAG